jgi:hypothetical protein
MVGGGTDFRVPFANDINCFELGATSNRMVKMISPTAASARPRPEIAVGPVSRNPFGAGQQSKRCRYFDGTPFGIELPLHMAGSI